MATPRPLAGLKVLEIGHSIAAPYAGMILGELGADVVKLENPGGGDYARGWGPPFSLGTATMFQAMNRAKRGIAVDLKDTAQRTRLRRLIIDDMDVVLHNLKPGALDRLGLGAEGLLADKPALIFCNIGAFGARGPLKHRPGYDPLMQAFGGLMSMLGEDGRPPVRVSVSIMDLATGMWSVIGILAAQAERQRTGKGGIIDASLFETSCAWMGIPIASYLASGKLPARAGSGVQEIVPYQAYAATDGYIMVAAGNDGLFRRLCGALHRPDLAADPRFETNAGRVAHRPELIGQLAQEFARDGVAAWVAKLEAVGVPSGPVQTLDQVVGHPQTEAMGMLQTGPEGGLRTMGLPLSFDGVRPPYERMAPALGAHNAEVLG
ncbi:CaiB/BaiF CoA transferase family protein [Limobrevibacterium gyesilva]|uniref:CoA transferase n=1 Tax=Limobrevibacterium gyesilva TaxID=2991712 RepID=A0AA41YLC4_9PROT|nr:CoA transferase [Limobrevibacterium gyesilva]MCW3474043.1 CoA transferase [Limobrevibacterium gyesilva]